MKLSNIVTRISYILVLIYLCYITYKHIDICSNNLEEFIDTGSSLSNLLKESVLSTFSKVDYSNLIDYSWGTKSEDKRGGRACYQSFWYCPLLFLHSER